MKKIFLFVAMLAMGFVTASAECQDGPYGLQINGTQVKDAPKFGDPDAQGRAQYKASCVELKAGDVIKLINQSCDATWMVDLDPYGDYANFSGGKSDGQLTCNVAGSYDFYIKLKDGDDLVYVELGKDCSGGNQGGGGQGGGNQGGGTAEGNPRYYYKGFIDDADFEPDDSSLFHDGIATINFTTNAMLFVIYQVDGQEGVQYMTSEWIDGPDHATLSVNGNGGYNKWNCPKGTTTLYLYDNGDGTLEISSKQIAGKTLVSGGGNQAIENAEVGEKARKVMVDGELRIYRGEKVYDATGRQL